MIARAIQEALTTSALTALKAAATAVKNGAQSADAVSAAIGADAPREVRNAIATLANSGQLNALPAVAAAYEQVSQKGVQILKALVTSAEALSDAKQAEVIADLRGKYGEDLAVSFDVDGSLIGGLIIRVGDRVLDNSLRTRLSAVKQSMVTS
jgi:F-type H+-transporting ATPase subunit delta